MYRSIRNSNLTLPLARGGGNLTDRNVLGVGHLTTTPEGWGPDSLPRFYVSSRWRTKAARVCLQILKQLPDLSVIIGGPILNVAISRSCLWHFGKTLETDISAQIISSDFRRKSGSGIWWGIWPLNPALTWGIWTNFLAPGWGIWPQLNEKLKCPGGYPGEGSTSFELIST